MHFITYKKILEENKLQPIFLVLKTEATLVSNDSRVKQAKMF